jgi:hypothetical protein
MHLLGEIEGNRVLFKRQVDDFLLAAHSAATANKVWDLINEHLRMPMKRYGLVSMYNGLDILQSRWYVKISIKTWLAIMMEPYLADWLDVPTTPMPTPFGPNESFIKRLYTTEGNPDKKIQAQLEKQFRFWLPTSNWATYLANDDMSTRPLSVGCEIGATQCCSS